MEIEMITTKRYLKFNTIDTAIKKSNASTTHMPYSLSMHNIHVFDIEYRITETIRKNDNISI